MAANTMQEAISAIQKADNGKYDYGNMKSPNKNIQAIHDAKNDELKSERVKQIEKERKEAVEYTFIISGMNYGPNANLLNESSSDSIMLVFDAVPNHSYSRTVEKTSFAVESGTTMSDHAVIKDDVISFEAIVNTSPCYIKRGNKIDEDTDPNNPVASRRPQKALDLLNRCINERTCIRVASEDGIYDDFIITKLVCKRSTEQGAALHFDIEMTQFRTFDIFKTVDAAITADPKKSPTKNKGAVQSSANGKNNPYAADKTQLTKPVEDGSANKHQGTTWTPGRDKPIKVETVGQTKKVFVDGPNVQPDIPN